MTIRSQLIFHVKPDKTDAFETAYIGGKILHLAQANPGYLGGELLRTCSTPPNYIALASWRSADDYEAWQTAYDTIPENTLNALIETLSAPPESSIMEMIDTASGAPAFAEDT